VFAICEQIRRVVLDSGAACEFQVVFELANDAWLFCAVSLSLCGRGRHHTRPFMVSLNQSLGFGESFFGVAAEQTWFGAPLQHMHQLPA
jgi:hypothetical protein